MKARDRRQALLRRLVVDQYEEEATFVVFLLAYWWVRSPSFPEPQAGDYFGTMAQSLAIEALFERTRAVFHHTKTSQATTLDELQQELAAEYPALNEAVLDAIYQANYWAVEDATGITGGVLDPNPEDHNEE